MAATHTLEGDLNTLVVGQLSRISRARIITNVPPHAAVIDTTGEVVHLGDGPLDVSQDGTFTADLVDTSATDLNIAANTLRYQLVVNYVSGRYRRQYESGWFAITADHDIADPGFLDDADPVAVASASSYAAQAESHALDAEAQVAAAAAQVAAAAAHRAAVEQVVVEDLGTTDGQSKTLIETDGTLTRGALLATIEAAVIGARHSNTLAMMGDSFLANTLIYEAGPLAWQHKPSAMLTGGRILLGQRLELVKDAGISGNTTTQMLARYDTDITPYGAGWVFIGGGTNDVDGGATAATIIANLTAMFDKADRDHARIIAATIPPRDANTAPKNAVLFEVNEWIRREAFVRPGMVLVDLYAALADPTAATFKSGISLDGIHPYTTAGGWRMARAFYDALKDVVPPVPVLPSSNVDSRSLITCGMFTGTAGGKGTGVTGTTASGWFVEPAPSLTCTAVVSKVARTDLGPGDMQEIEVTAGTAQARARNTAVGTAWNPGDEVYATIAFEADTLPTTPAASVFDLNVTCYNAGFSRLLRGVDNGLMAYEFEALNIPASGVMRTPSIVIPALTTTLQITVTMSAGAKVRLYQAELVKGSWL